LWVRLSCLTYGSDNVRLESLTYFAETFAMPRGLLTISFVAIMAFTPSLIWAQGSRSSSFGSSRSSGMGMGSSGMGMGSFGSGFGSSGLGLSNPFGSGIGGGLGSNSLGTAGFGSSQFGSSGFGSAGFGSSRFGSSGYGNGGGVNFVGRDAADAQGVWGQTSNAANQFFNNMNRNMRQQSRRSRSTHQTAQNPPQPMRVEVKVGFTPPGQSQSQLAETIRTRLTKILADHKMSAANFTMEGGVAVLRGVAATEDERAVIGQLVALQPEISDVRNEMTVAAPFSGTVPVPGS
jgi:hypothetical protein